METGNWEQEIRNYLSNTALHSKITHLFPQCLYKKEGGIGEIHAMRFPLLVDTGQIFETGQLTVCK